MVYHYHDIDCGGVYDAVVRRFLKYLYTFVYNTMLYYTSVCRNPRAEFIQDKMKNHSWYVQQLAHYTWNATAKKGGKNEVVKKNILQRTLLLVQVQSNRQTKPRFVLIDPDMFVAIG